MSLCKSSFLLLLLAADITGTWNVVMESVTNGKITSSFVINQKQNNLSGSYKGQRGEFPLSGTIKDSDVTVVIETPRGSMKYMGKLDTTGRKFAGKYEGAGI